eukprot:GHVR01086199.1.p1 GENE.GHVR01086199.1~~GHVR01086199.1.p1  ORF type:complete len:365 (+),score=80.67 GHVR01086199.1:93-1187(+)
MKQRILPGHERPVTFVRYNDDGDLLFTCGKDKEILMFNAKDGKLMGMFKGHNGAICNVDITRDSKYLMSASTDSTLFIWDVETGDKVIDFRMSGPVKFAEFSRKPERHLRFCITVDAFAAIPSYMGINRVDLFPVNKIKEKDNEEKKGILKEELTIKETTVKCQEIHWGAYDKTLVSVHEDGKIRIWSSDFDDNDNIGTLIHTIDAHSKMITSACFSHDRCIMLTTSADCNATLWDLVHVKPLQKYTTDRPLNAGAIHPLSSERYEGDSQLGTVSQSRPNRYHILLGGGQDASQVTQTSAGEGKFQLILMHMIQGVLLGTLKGGFSPINAIAYAPDGSGFASGFEEGQVRLYHFDDDIWGDNFD